MSLGNTTFETKRATGRNPVFDETFFLLVRNIATDRLILTVQGENKLRRTKQSNEAAEDLVRRRFGGNSLLCYSFSMYCSIHLVIFVLLCSRRPQLDLARAENIQKQYTFGHSTLHVRCRRHVFDIRGSRMLLVY